MNIATKRRLGISTDIIGWSERILGMIFIVSILRFLLAQWLGGSFWEHSYLASTTLILVIVGWRFPRIALIGILLGIPWIAGWGRVGGWIIPEQNTAMVACVWLGTWWKTRHVPNRMVTKTDFLIHFFAWVISIAWLRSVYSLAQSPSDRTQLLSGIVWSFYSPYIGLSMGFEWLTGIMSALLLRRIFDQDLRNCVRWALPRVWCVSILTFAAIQQVFDWPTRYAPWIFSAPFDDVHSFGSVSVVLLVFAAGFLVSVKRFSLPHCFWILAGCVFVLGSWSRSAWIATIILALLFVLKWLRVMEAHKRLHALGKISLVATALVIAFFAVPRANMFGSKIRSLAQPGSMIQRNHERLVLWGIAIRMAEEHPLLGQGLGQFFQRSASFDDEHQIVDKLNFAHNNYLQVAAELGFPAAIAILVIVILAVKDFAVGGLEAVEAGAVGGYGLTMLFNHPLILASQLIIFWSLVGFWTAGWVSSNSRDKGLTCE